jgi:ketosteroid isomerase-like protein
MGAEDEIRGLLDTYEHSLNTSDASLATACYASDGVFMPTGLPTASGEEMQGAYDRTFAAIRLNVAFSVDELVVANDKFAYGMTRSNGTQTILATGAESAESNREVFIFGVEDGCWKISRYMFNKPQ